MHPKAKLEADLKRLTRFVRLTHLPECDSTQDLAAIEPTDSDDEPTDALFWADHQSRGRGRQERAWDDQPGLDLAVTMRVTTKLSNPLALPASLPVAVLQTCEPIAGQQLRIKWPNDVYAADKKLSGVLIDRDTKRPDTYRIGVGINVNSVRFDGDLAATGTSLALLSKSRQDRESLVLSLARHVDAMITAIEADDVGMHEQIFRERIGLMGEHVEVRGRDTMQGKLTAIDFERLVLDDQIKVPLAIVRSLSRAPQ